MLIQGSLHKCDQSILEQLQTVHSSVSDLKNQQKSAFTVNRQLEKKYLYNSFEEDEDDKEENNDVLNDFQFELDLPPHKMSMNYFGKTPTPPLKTPTPPLVVHEQRNSSPAGGRRGSGQRVMLDMGVNPGGRAVMVGKTAAPSAAKVMSPPIRTASPLARGPSPSVRGPSPLERGVSPGKQDKRKAELKADPKNEGRSSVFLEMQLLRQKLQDAAKEELAALQFDIEPPKPAAASGAAAGGGNQLGVLQEDSALNRYSIFGRMDQLLSSSRSPGHTRQSSEPVNLGSLSYGDMHISPPSFGSSANVHRTNSEQYRNSPGPRRPNYATHELRHGTGSNSSVSSGGHRESSGSNSPESTSTHYNTSVIRGRKKSKENGTLEKKRNALQYSVESLNEKDNVYDHLSGQEPEYQNIASSVPNGGSSLPRYQGRNPGYQQRSHNPLIHSKSDMSFSSSSDVYPEVASGRGESIQPYMTRGELTKEMEAFQPKRPFVYTPYSETATNKERKSSYPVHASSRVSYSSSHGSSHSHKQRSYLPSERTWL